MCVCIYEHICDLSSSCKTIFYNRLSKILFSPCEDKMT